MTELARKSCTACKSGVAPLTEAEAQPFLAAMPAWRLLDQGTRIERAFRFRNFVAALDFVGQVGEIAEAEGHHPDITFGWGYARISLFTHKIKGLHENDFIVAAKIDRLSASGAG